MSKTATIFNVQRFSIHDGPGTRTTVFFKGCNLSCRWCHNPESQICVKQISFTQNNCTNCGDCAKACPNATNVRFTKDFIDTEKGIKTVANFIRYSMQKGCFELQFNVVSAETLKKANENPQDYKTLMVRVAGYSDYFVKLNPIIQEEIISRTEHGAV